MTAIIYDPSSLTLEKKDRGTFCEHNREACLADTDQIAATDDLIEAKVPGRGFIVDLYLKVGSDQNQVEAFFATVDLGKLGREVKWQRRRGDIDSVWVRGKHISA
jgi:hypothetical protein